MYYKKSNAGANHEEPVVVLEAIKPKEVDTF